MPRHADTSITLRMYLNRLRSLKASQSATATSTGYIPQTYTVFATSISHSCGRNHC